MIFHDVTPHDMTSHDMKWRHMTWHDVTHAPISEARTVPAASANSGPAVSDRHKVLQQILDHEYRYIMSLKDIKKVGTIFIILHWIKKLPTECRICFVNWTVFKCYKLIEYRCETCYYPLFYFSTKSVLTPETWSCISPLYSIGHVIWISGLRHPATTYPGTQVSARSY